jgi:hypothetical protein
MNTENSEIIAQHLATCRVKGGNAPNWSADFVVLIHNDA